MPAVLFSVGKWIGTISFFFPHWNVPCLLIGEQPGKAENKQSLNIRGSRPPSEEPWLSKTMPHTCLADSPAHDVEMCAANLCTVGIGSCLLGRVHRHLLAALMSCRWLCHLVQHLTLPLVKGFSPCHGHLLFLLSEGCLYQ